MKHTQILFSLLFIAALASCNQGSSTTENNGGGNAGMWTIPGIGTTYIYKGPPPSDTDTSGPEIDTVTLVNSRQHIGGKTDVMCILNASQADTSFFNIESNGNFSIGNVGTNDSDGVEVSAFTWVEYPTGTHQTISQQLDTVEFGEHTVTSDVRQFIGSENITTAAGQFSTLHIRETNINDDFPHDTTGTSVTDTSFTDIWFAPSIGLFVKYASGDPQQQDNFESDLIKYIPK